MDEVENKIAEVELAPLETTPQEESTETSQVANHAQEENFRNLRQGKKEAERRVQELERQAKMQQELLGQLMASRQPQAEQAPVDELDNVSDEDYIPKGQVKKLLQRERENSRKIAQEEVQKTLQEQEKSQFHSRLKNKFSDFDDVVNPETLELLEQQNPDIARTIVKLGDPYDMGLQSYTFIKSLGLAQKIPESRRAKEVDKKIEQNKKTVQSPLAYDKRPMAQTFQMTEEYLSEVNKEMMRYANMT